MARSSDARGRVTRVEEMCGLDRKGDNRELGTGDNRELGTGDYRGAGDR